MFFGCDITSGLHEPVFFLPQQQHRSFRTRVGHHQFHHFNEKLLKIGFGGKRLGSAYDIVQIHLDWGDGLGQSGLHRAGAAGGIRLPVWDGSCFKPLRVAVFKVADLGSCPPLMVKGACFAHVHFGNPVVAAFLPEAGV